MTKPTCSIEGCDRTLKAQRLCAGHLRCLQRLGDPGPARIEIPPHARQVGPENGSWKGDQVSYRGAHSRVATERGPASKHACVGGCGNPAQEWAYDHTDPNERVGTGHAQGCTYSVDPAYYQPMCRTCHKKLDWSVRKAKAVAR